MFSRISSLFGAALFVTAAGVAPAIAQPLFELPRPSQAASVTQRIGVTDITVSYHRPGVKGRTIWGEVVPYGEVWRAGANENTTITFSDAVTIGGKHIAAGTYGLHVLPTEAQWTFILSKQSQAWGSFSYDEKEDAVRVTAKPQAAPQREWLLYTFDDPGDDAVDVTLSWDKLSASFRVEVATKDIVAERLRNGLRGLPRFFWKGWSDAAAWCVTNDTNLAEAEAWIDRSLGMAKNFTNVNVKAQLLEKKGETAAAAKLRSEAMGLASEAELNLYGYQLMGQDKMDEALAVFKRNTKTHPDSWNVWDSLGEAQLKAGDVKSARANYKKALAMVKDDTQKQRIEKVLAKMKD